MVCCRMAVQPHPPRLERLPGWLFAVSRPLLSSQLTACLDALQRYQCKKCEFYFCDAHKSKIHHGCPYLRPCPPAADLSSSRGSFGWSRRYPLSDLCLRLFLGPRPLLLSKHASGILCLGRAVRLSLMHVACVARKAEHRADGACWRVSSKHSRSIDATGDYSLDSHGSDSE